MAIYFPHAAGSYSNLYNSSSTSNTVAVGKKTWDEFLTAVYGSAVTTALVDGKASYYVTWTGVPGYKVDIDLVANEPDGNWAGPVEGPSSPNAFSSADSFYSDRLTESYTLAVKVKPGQYDIFANLFACTDNTTNAPLLNATCTTEVKFCYKLGAATTFTCDAPVTLNLGGNVLSEEFYIDPFADATLPLTGTLWTNVAANKYSDWRKLGPTLTRGGVYVAKKTKGKRLKVIFKKKSFRS